MSDVLLCQGTACHLPLRDASVHCCVTSPPYFGLRDYGTATWEGGDPACTHIEKASARNDVTPERLAARAAQYGTGQGAGSQVTALHYRQGCPHCGAVRVDAQLGLEPTLEAYLAALVAVFREVWRVLRPDGTLWLNLGDVYTSGNRSSFGPLTGKNVSVKTAPRAPQPPGLPPKSLLGLPWRVALALQADGWILRSDIIWEKPSCLPESVQDRPTRSHEYVFLLSKSPRYFYDDAAVREPQAISMLRRTDARRIGPKMAREDCNSTEYPKQQRILEHGRNARTVWRLPSEPFSGGHFATFPTALVRHCLLAGAPTQVCAACGAPWGREVEKSFRPMTDRAPTKLARASGRKGIDASRQDAMTPRGYCDVLTTGFAPTCACAADTYPSVVLDPFAGSGTTGLVARELGCHAVLVDLSFPYLRDIARERLGLAALARWEGRGVQATPALAYDALPLFGACVEDTP